MSRLVVAADGREPSDVALAAARSLAGTSAFRVVSVSRRTRREIAPSDGLTFLGLPRGCSALVGEQLRRGRRWP